MNFCYKTKDFDRLSQLTEYNTRINLDVIKAEILRAIRAKQLTTKMSLRDVVKMKIMSRKSKADFIWLVRQMQQGGMLSADPSRSPSVQSSRPASGSGSAAGREADRGALLSATLEKFVSALDLVPDAPDGESALGPHLSADRFLSAEDVAEASRPHSDAGTSR